MSSEGTTQGDNAASGFYSLSILPLIKMLAEIIHTHQIWYADDAAAGGYIEYLRIWWDKIVKEGPALGYYPNAKKTWLVVKMEHIEAAKSAFADTGVNITTEGQRYLGAAIGTSEYKENYVKDKVQTWMKELSELTEISKCEPQLCFAAYIFSLSKRWIYLMRTMNSISHLLKPLDDQITNTFIPTLINYPFSELERSLFSLPIRMGGLNLFIPSEISDLEYSYSKKATLPLIDMIRDQKVAYDISN